MKIRTPEGEIEAEVADSILKRAVGLSLRKRGKMIFNFPGKTRAPIDMMLMRRPLHLYFMNSEKEVVHVEKAEPWYRLPGKLFHRPGEKYRYLLESFEELGIDEGDNLEF
ncbi:MAG: DUF192 domain-containing protein [Candidatus Nanohalobium sp.]